MSNITGKYVGNVTGVALGETQLSEVRSTRSLADQVARLEQNHDDLSGLCGEMLATLRINFTRGTFAILPPADRPEKADELQAMFAEWLDACGTRLNILTANAALHRQKEAQ